MDKHVTSVLCRKKTFVLDDNPYRLEIWGETLPFHFVGFPSLEACEEARELVVDFLSKFRALRASSKRRQLLAQAKMS